MVASVCVKNGILAVVLVDDGSVYNKKVMRVPYEDRYDNVASGVAVAARMLGSIGVQEDEIVFEVTSGTVVNWFRGMYAGGTHQERFAEAFAELDAVPMRYSFICNQKPVAWYFAEERYIESDTVEGLDI